MAGNLPSPERVGRKTRARVVLAMLQLAQQELDAVALETDPVRAKERSQLANRMIVDAIVAVRSWEVRG